MTSDKLIPLEEGDTGTIRFGESPPPPVELIHPVILGCLPNRVVEVIRQMEGLMTFEKPLSRSAEVRNEAIAEAITIVRAGLAERVGNLSEEPEQKP
jgi:hypothetical protein